MIGTIAHITKLSILDFPQTSACQTLEDYEKLLPWNTKLEKAQKNRNNTSYNNYLMRI
jgi:hypothetical protein